METIVRKAIKRMKNKKASDRLGWKTEWRGGNGKKFTYIVYQGQNRKSNTKTVEIDNSEKYS